MKKKYMGIEYTITSVGTRKKWSVADGGLYGSGFADNSNKAAEHAETWIKSKKK